MTRTSTRRRTKGRFLESAGVTAARTHRVNGPFHIVVHCFERRPTAASNPGNQRHDKYTSRCRKDKRFSCPAQVRKSALKRAEARAPERGVHAASPGFALVSPVSN